MSSEQDQAPGANRQRIAYAVLGGIMIACTALAAVVPTADYTALLGTIPPLIVMVGAVVVGGVVLDRLRASTDFEILRGPPTLRGIGKSALIATGLAVPVIIADVLLRYPETINTPLPGALLFYPTAGFVAEVIFHLVPLALLLALTHPLRHRISPTARLWFTLALVAMSEPAFQVVFVGADSALSVFTAIQVFAVSAAQLWVFRRYDFFTMYALRLVYYLHWHFIWGWLRLELLF